MFSILSMFTLELLFEYCENVLSKLAFCAANSNLHLGITILLMALSTNNQNNHYILTNFQQLNHNEQKHQEPSHII